MGAKASESTEVKIFGQIPPIEKMDASLSTLACCELVWALALKVSIILLWKEISYVSVLHKIINFYFY